MGLLKEMITEGFNHNWCQSPGTPSLIWGCLHIPKQVHVRDMPSYSTWVAASGVGNLGAAKFIAQNHITDELQGRWS